MQMLFYGIDARGLFVTNTRKDAPGLVSVVIPVFNAEEYLERTLASVFAQTYPHIQVTAVDDGSTDGSLGILERHEDRLTIVRQQNRGVAVARNRGVMEADGEWIAFLDADDLWHPHKIERQLRICEGFDWSHTDSVFMGGANDGHRDSELTAKSEGMVFEQLVCSNFIGTSSVMIRRDCFIAHGGFRESLSSIEDWDLWIRVSRTHAVGYLDEPMMRYRVHAASASRRTRSTLPNHLKVIDSVFEDGSADSLQHLKSVAKASSYGICSQIAEEEGDYGLALRCAAWACVHSPLDGRRWVRAAKSTVKYAIAQFGFGFKVAFFAWWVNEYASLAAG
jgi:hypothetical protein